MTFKWTHGFIQLAENIYAYIDPEGTWFKSNSGLVIGDRYNIIIDSQANEDRMKIFLGYVKNTSDKPVKIVVNTHYHGDHVWTNHMVKEAVTVSHIKCWEETFRQRNFDPNMYTALFPDLSFKGAKYTPQDIVFKEKMYIKMEEDLTLNLIYLGPAHTTSDIIVHIPEYKIVFSGDLLFYGVTPLALDGYVTGWINALNYLLKMDVKTFVPGHGPPIDKSGIIEVKNYFQYIFKEAKKFFKMSYDPYEAAKNIDLRKYLEWKDWERIVPNIERIYMELKEEQPAKPLPDVFSTAYKMLKYKKNKQI